MAVTREELLALRAKYAEIRSLRDGAAAGDDPPSDRLARLAAEFPGALRELDDCALEHVRAREAELDRAAAAGGTAAPWMIATALFHRTMRGALAAKRWLGGRRSVDEEIRAAFRAAAATLAFPEDAATWAADLEQIARPPRGRLSVAAFARVAATMGVSEREARHLVFGPSRRERSAS